MIPESGSNYYTDECTQLSSNNYKNRPDELLSAYWGNHYDDKVLDSPKNNNNKFGEFDNDRKSNFLLCDFKEDNSRLIYPNKFHFNPEGPCLFSTPPSYKTRPREYEREPFNSMNIDYFKKNANNFSDYFNSVKRGPPQNEGFSQNLRDFTNDTLYDDYFGRSKG